MKPTVGRIVYYQLLTDSGTVEERPAIIVRVWSDDCVQLQVFTDGTNDGKDYVHGITWRTSVVRDESHQPGTWDWMPYQKEQATKQN